MQTSLSLKEIASKYNAVIRGWLNYYGRFYKSEMKTVINHINVALIKWIRRKLRNLERRQRCAAKWLSNIAKREPRLFAHWNVQGSFSMTR